MEQRKHPRVQLPLLVELQHPSLPSSRYIARDISEGGVFVHLVDAPASIRPGSRLRLTLLNPIDIENRPTPTVEMIVRRVEDNGIGLEFANRTSSHLWRSVERLRDELAIGRDYFQVHQSALVVNERDQLLLVQLHGKWGYPGNYLIVGEDWQESIKRYLQKTFQLADMNVVRVLDANSDHNFDLPEAAVFKTFVLVSANASSFSMTATQRYRNARWVSHRRDVEETTFISDDFRRLALEALSWARSGINPTVAAQ